MVSLSWSYSSSKGVDRSINYHAVKKMFSLLFLLSLVRHVYYVTSFSNVSVLLQHHRMMMPSVLHPFTPSCAPSATSGAVRYCRTGSIRLRGEAGSDDAPMDSSGTFKGSNQGDDLRTFTARESEWSKMPRNLRAAIVRNRENRKRARRNKDKRTPKMTKKREVIMRYEKAARSRKAMEKTERREYESRGKLDDIVVGDTIDGRVISIVQHGIFVDVGCEKDVLLHVSEMHPTDFVPHPSDLVDAGEDISVYVKYSKDGKVGLTLNPSSVPGTDSTLESRDSILLTSLYSSDELWGVITKVTNFGGFVDFGGEVDGFVHFMDHPTTV